MKKAEDLIPKNKFDFSGVEELRKLSDEEIAPIIPDLLAWMKDMNWPIAREMPTLLVKHQKVIMSHIDKILQPEQLESDWKSFIIWELLPLLDDEYWLIIKPCLERIVEKPTRGEIDDETDVAAKNFLQKQVHKSMYKDL